MSPERWKKVVFLTILRLIEEKEVSARNRGPMVMEAPTKAHSRGHCGSAECEAGPIPMMHMHVPWLPLLFPFTDTVVTVVDALAVNGRDL